MECMENNNVEWLAREIARDRTLGSSVIDLDWGNYRIKCEDYRLKDILVRLAEEYLELKDEKSKVLQAMHAEEKK
jgi:hypothetical protein